MYLIVEKEKLEKYKITFEIILGLQTRGPFLKKNKSKVES